MLAWFASTSSLNCSISVSTANTTEAVAKRSITQMGIPFSMLSYRGIAHAHLNIESLFPNTLVEIEERDTYWRQR